jgi:hypothetical protein
MIHKEKISGARADRPQLAKLMSALRAGDVVVVTKLDRLGRSTRELLEREHSATMARTLHEVYRWLSVPCPHLEAVAKSRRCAAGKRFRRGAVWIAVAKIMNGRGDGRGGRRHQWPRNRDSRTRRWSAHPAPALLSMTTC